MRNILFLSIFVLMLMTSCGDDQIGGSGQPCYEDGSCDYDVSCDVSNHICRA